VAAYLANLDLSAFDPKAPPPKTDAFWAIVDATARRKTASLPTCWTASPSRMAATSNGPQP
jgi:hypothetical protein